MNEAAYHAILRRLGVEPVGPERDDLVARLLDMPLDVFAREGQPLEVRVSADCWPETLWFVPDVLHAEALWREGIARERVWTASELTSLLEGPAWAPEGLRVVMVARREFRGEVVATQRRA